MRYSVKTYLFLFTEVASIDIFLLYWNGCIFLYIYIYIIFFFLCVNNDINISLLATQSNHMASEDVQHKSYGPLVWCYFVILWCRFELNSLDPHFLFGWTIPLRSTCHIIYDKVAQCDPQCGVSRHAVYKTQKQTNEEREKDGLKLRRDCEDERECYKSDPPPPHSENEGGKTKSAAVKPTAQLQSSIYTRTRLLERWQSHGLGCNHFLPLSQSPEVSSAMLILTSKHCIGFILI